MASLFISYSRRDIPMARKLTDALKGQDLDFWIDWEGIPPTVDWWEEIQKGIEEADIFLFLISPDSANSKVCKREIEHAVQNGKRLIPVVVRDVTATEVPYELSSLNWIFLREADDFNPAFGKLITAIKTDYAWAQAHRQLQVKALEWDRSNHENSFLLRGKELQSAELQLATNSSKEPHPTDLQRAYVLRSRQTADRQRRIITFMAIGAAIAMTGLAIFGFVQARLATERATLSRAGELAAQSVALRDRNFPVSLLLSVEAFKTRDTVQTRSALVDDIQASPGLLAYLTRNPSRVDSVAFSPDGKILASGGGDNKIILWDVGTGQPIGQPLKKHRNWIRSLAFAPDGKILASGGNDGSVILWDLKTSQPIGQPLKAKKGVVSSVAFTPDGKILASGHADGTLILWDVRTHQPLGQPLRGHTSWISSLAISPDGKTLASGSEDHTIILWDIKTQQPIDQPLSAHSRTILSLAFSPDGKMLASGSEDNTVVLWDAARRRPIGQPLRGHTKFVGSVAFSPDGKLLASGGYDRIIILWEVATRQPIGQPLRGHTDVIHSVTFSADGKMLASGSEDGTIILWDVATALHPTLEPGAFISQVLREHAKPVNSVAFSPDGRNLASGDNDGTLILWDVSTLLNISIKTKRPIGLALQDHTNVVSSLAFTPDGKILASGSSDGTVILWDVSAAHNTGAKTEQAVKRTLTGNGDFITTIAFSPDGKTLAAGAGNSSILLWDVKTGRLIGQPLPGHTNIVESVAFSPNGKILASGSYDTTVILSDVATGQPLDQLRKEYHGSATSVAFSPDGKILASGYGDGLIILWDVATRQPIGQPLSGHNGVVNSVAFSPNGKILASGAGDNMVALWDVGTKQPIGAPLSGYTDYVSSVAFSPNGKILASGSFDSSIVLWDVDPDSWIQKTCQRVGRNFTKNEWEKYFPNEKYRATCPHWPLGS